MGSDEEESDDFAAFVRASRGWMRRTAFYLCGDWHESEDLVQIALINIYRIWGAAEGKARRLSYARRVLINAFLDERRRLRWQRETFSGQLPDVADRDDDLRRVEDRDMLLRALTALGPRQRAVIVLRFAEDLSAAETAEILDCNVATVRSQTSRALATMRGIVAT